MQLTIHEQSCTWPWSWKSVTII